MYDSEIEYILLENEVDEPDDIPDEVWINEYNRCPVCHEEFTEGSFIDEAWGHRERIYFTYCPNCE